MMVFVFLVNPMSIFSSLVAIDTLALNLGKLLNFDMLSPMYSLQNIKYLVKSYTMLAKLDWGTKLESYLTILAVNSKLDMIT